MVKSFKEHKGLAMVVNNEKEESPKSLHFWESRTERWIERERGRERGRLTKRGGQGGRKGGIQTDIDHPGVREHDIEKRKETERERDREEERGELERCGGGQREKSDNRKQEYAETKL